MESVLHREVGDARGARSGLLGHVGLELGVYRIEVSEEFGVLLQLVEPLDAQLVEEGDGVALALVPEHGVNLLEEVAGAGIPAPPEVARELLEGAQSFGQRLVDHHAVPVGLLDEELLADEVDLLGLAAAVGGHGAVGALHGALHRLGIGALIGCVEVLPERRLGRFAGRGAHLPDALLRELAEADEGVGDFDLDLAGVEVVAADNLHAVVLLVRGDPQSEAGQRRGDGRHGEGHRLERRVAPRLVVGGEYRDIHAHEQLVVVLVEDAVVLVEVRGDEYDLDLRAGRGQHAAVDGVDDGVPRLVLEVVGRVLVLAAVDGFRGVGQMGLQVTARAAVAGRHGDVGEHLALETVRRGQLLERLDEDVEPLVAELVAAAGADDERVRGELLAQAGLRYRNHRLAGLGALGVVLGAAPYEVVLETVGRHAVDLAAQQVLALVGRDVAHGQEDVVVRGGHLLNRVFGHDVELAGQAVGVELRQLAVERESVAGDAAAGDRGVGGEDGGDVGGGLTQVEAAGGGHPLVEVGHDLLGGRAEVLGVGGDDDARGVAEEHRLDVVPLTRDGVDVVGLPEVLEDVVLLGDERGEVDEDDQRTALDLPAADADAQSLAVYALAPRLQQLEVLLEFGVRSLVLEIGTDEDIVVTELAGCGQGFGGDDGVDAAHLVAYLPAYLEQVVGSCFRVAHGMIR